MSLKPKWEYKVSAEYVTKMYYSVTKVTLHVELTGVDTSKDWVEFHTDSGKFRAPRGWEELFEFKPTYRSLLSPTYKGKQAIALVRSIQKWEEQNKSDIQELERLRVKLGLENE